MKNYRSSHRRCSVKKGNSNTSVEEHLRTTASKTGIRENWNKNNKNIFIITDSLPIVWYTF